MVGSRPWENLNPRGGAQTEPIQTRTMALRSTIDSRDDITPFTIDQRVKMSDNPVEIYGTPEELLKRILMSPEYLDRLAEVLVSRLADEN